MDMNPGDQQGQGECGTTWNVPRALRERSRLNISATPGSTEGSLDRVCANGRRVDEFSYVTEEDDCTNEDGGCRKEPGIMIQRPLCEEIVPRGCREWARSQ